MKKINKAQFEKNGRHRFDLNLETTTHTKIPLTVRQKSHVAGPQIST